MAACGMRTASFLSKISCENDKSADADASALFWRRGCDSNAQCLAAHHISNVAPYQLEYLSKWLYFVIIGDSLIIITDSFEKIKGVLQDFLNFA